MSTAKCKLFDEALSLVTADKQWPQNVQLYKALQEQELLPDIARCYSIEALLAVHELQNDYERIRRHNAEYMAPKEGHLPFLRIGDTIIGRDEVIDFLQKKDKQLYNERTVEDNICLKGIISLIENKLTSIEFYMIWIDEDNLQQTLEKYSFNQPPPLKQILCYQKQKEVRKCLQVTGWLQKSQEEIKRELQSIFDFLSRKLENQTYLIGDQLSEADVFVYGHIQAILECKLKNNLLLTTLEEYPKLTHFALNFNQVQLGHQAMLFNI